MFDKASGTGQDADMEPHRTPPFPPLHRLRILLAERDETQQQFGERVGVTGGTIHKWITGGARPTYENALRLHHETGGVISVADFYPAPGDTE